MALTDQLRATYRKLVPDELRHTYYYRSVRQFFWNRQLRSEFGVASTKYARELNFWRSRFEAEGGRLNNAHYEAIFMAMAGEADRTFITDRVIADFGAGPRGSLEWAREARVRVCIDVLGDQYMPFGIGDHAATYVTNREDHIPLPSNYVDVLFTLNALDHVDDLSTICDELFRVLKPGGLFIASFNLHEPRTFAEPQTLSEDKLNRVLLNRFRIERRRIGKRGPDDAAYEHMMSGGQTSLAPGDKGFFVGSSDQIKVKAADPLGVDTRVHSTGRPERR